MCRYAFEQLGAERIEICAEPENQASQGVALKARLSNARASFASTSRSRACAGTWSMHSLLRGELR